MKLRNILREINKYFLGKIRTSVDKTRNYTRSMILRGRMRHAVGASTTYRHLGNTSSKRCLRSWPHERDLSPSRKQSVRCRRRVDTPEQEDPIWRGGDRVPRAGTRYRILYGPRRWSVHRLDPWCLCDLSLCLLRDALADNSRAPDTRYARTYMPLRGPTTLPQIRTILRVFLCLSYRFASPYSMSEEN